MRDFPDFESVYDWVESFGRTRSPSFRMWRGARRLLVAAKYPTRSPQTRRLRRAIKKLREMRSLAPAGSKRRRPWPKSSGSSTSSPTVPSTT